jgi:hypothetical protein
MRVYLPSTLPAIAGALKSAEAGPAPLAGFAVTAALREWYASGDLEELEYAAMSDAARASLRLLADDPDAPRRRAVLVAEVPDAQVTASGELSERGAVTVSEPVPIARIAAGHVDAVDAEPDIALAVDALPAADLGDDDASFLVDGAEGHELLWYATQELQFL